MSGRKVFTAGEVLQAADVNDFLMDQSVMVFAGTAARGSAIPSPTEGMVTYRSDDDTVEVYDGSSWNAVGPGQILQVVSTTKTDTFSSSSSSAVNVTGLSASITPSSTSSKILIFASIYSSASNASASFVLFSITGGNASSYQGSGGNGEFNLPPQNGAWSSPDLRGDLTMANYLDSPSTTSSVTYQVQARSPGGATFYINRHATEGSPAVRGASTITLMEVAG